MYHGLDSNINKGSFKPQWA